ncbi:hypothetical protein GCM10023177_12130 [Streptomyces violaceoruber]
MSRGGFQRGPGSDGRQRHLGRRPEHAPAASYGCPSDTPRARCRSPGRHRPESLTSDVTDGPDGSTCALGGGLVDLLAGKPNSGFTPDP